MMVPRGHTIHHGSITLDVAVVGIDEVKPHEETIPSLLSQLTAEIRRDGILRNPIVVDRESLVILDGMHRLAALKSLGCLRIPVCLVEYSSPFVKLGCWYRSFVDSGWRDKVRSVLTALNLRFTESDVRAAETKVVNGSAVAFKSLSESLVATDGFVGGLGVFNAVQQIERGLLQLGLRMTYDTESDAQARLQAGLAEVVMSYTPATKEIVLQTAMSGATFPPKTTRHIIPARPMGVNLPLSLLRNRSLSTKEVNAGFVASLRGRKLTRMPPGSLDDGRRYEEDLYVFEG
jgi:hypothetical protein